MADVVLIILWLANSLKINLDQELDKVFKKVESRDKDRFHETKYDKTG